MSFKESIEADIKNVFLNVDEYAEKHTVIYDCTTFSDIPVLITKLKESERAIQGGNKMEGIHIVTALMHVAISDLNGVVPEPNQYIEIDDGVALGRTFYVKYRIVTSATAGGMCNMELEVYDE